MKETDKRKCPAERERDLINELVKDVELWKIKIYDIEFTNGRSVYPERIRQAKHLIRSLNKLVQDEKMHYSKVISNDLVVKKARYLFAYCVSFSKNLSAANGSNYSIIEVVRSAYWFPLLDTTTLSDILNRYKSLGHGGYTYIYDLSDFLKETACLAIDYIIEFK